MPVVWDKKLLTAPPEPKPGRWANTLLMRWVICAKPLVLKTAFSNTGTCAGPTRSCAIEGAFSIFDVSNVVALALEPPC